MASDRGQHVVVVGAGVIGLCCAYHLSRNGFDVTIVDRDPDGDRASFGNAGAIAQSEIMPLAAPGTVLRVPKYLLDPLGPLAIRIGYLPRLIPYLTHFLAASRPRRFRAGAAAMASLLATAFEDHETILQSIGQQDLLKRAGHMWIYRSEASRDREAENWRRRADLGYTFEFVGHHTIRDLEPSLGEAAVCGVHTDDWAHYADPKVFVIELRRYLESRGVRVRPGEVRDVEFRDAHPIAVLGQDGKRFDFDLLVVAAGAWSHQISRRLGDDFPLETERGYNTTLPDPAVTLNRMITFSDDHIVATPMSMGLRIGGAVEFAGLTAAPNPARAKALLKLARRYLPGLRDHGSKEWMGHRPSTPDSLPVISRAGQHDNVFYAFGHGHLGLTGSATTGRLIAAVITGEPTECDLGPFRIDRFR